MQKRITIKDVAKLAGVAPSTVSFVLNDVQSQTITQETREKVFSAVEHLHYRPNYMASALKQSSAKTIGIVVTNNVHNLYFHDMLTGIMKACEGLGYGILIFENGRTMNEDVRYVKSFQSGRIDGIVFLSSAHSEKESHEQEHISLFEKYNIPFAVIYGYTQQEGICYSNIDFFQCGYISYLHLAEQGCRNICYLAPLNKDGSAPYDPKTERDKKDGYRAAMHRFQSQNDPNIICLRRAFFDDDLAGTLHTLQTLIQEKGVDGIVACWASFGMQVLKALHLLSIPVPDRVKVIALDTMPFLEHTDPGLSSVQLPFYEIGFKGATMLIQHRLLAKDTAATPPSLLASCTIVERPSSTTNSAIALEGNV